MSSGSPARYRLTAECRLDKTISAIKALSKRRVPLIDAKRQIEAIMLGGELTVDVPMVEDAAAFERELGELGIRAVPVAAAAAAAAAAQG